MTVMTTEFAETLKDRL